MADPILLRILEKGVYEWNQWKKQQDVLYSADLSGANLSGANLSGVNLSDANLSGANLSGANLSRANLFDVRLTQANLSGAVLFRASLFKGWLSRADLSGANLLFADFCDSILFNANLSRAHLTRANLSGADLSRADLSGAHLTRANLSSARLMRTKFEGARAVGTVFGDLDLRGADGLESVIHSGPSQISTGTIYMSEGKIPEKFLLGCGVSESFIAQVPALVAAMQPVQFHSCFISYSGKDEEFARRLHSRMRQAELRVWFAPEDMKGGDKLYDQIDSAIQVHDRLLLVLSESSLQSKWVELEIRRARKVELREGRRKLFPIRLVSYEALQEWMCIDSATGEDLAEEVRSYFIPDFSNWKNYDDLELAFARLLADLKASA